MVEYIAYFNPDWPNAEKLDEVGRYSNIEDAIKECSTRVESKYLGKYEYREHRWQMDFFGCLRVGRHPDFVLAYVDTEYSTTEKREQEKARLLNKISLLEAELASCRLTYDELTKENA